MSRVRRESNQRQLLSVTMRGLCLLLCIVSWPCHINGYSVNRNSLWKKISETDFPFNQACSRRIASFSLVTAIVSLLPTVSNAACLMGDTSPDCIGVYKMPMDDTALKYVDTPEKLKQYAPDVRWVPPVSYPKSYKEAKSELNSLQQRCATLDSAVLQGNLTEVGIELLGIIPRLTVDGRFVIQTLNEAKSQTGVDMSMKAYRAESAHSELLNKLGQCDILIGQAINGQLGAPAPAQLQILGDVKEANTLFDEFMRSIPDDFKPKKIR